MLGIPRAFAAYVFGILQSILTTGVATGIAAYPFAGSGSFLRHWLGAWATAFAVLLPVVLLAAPQLRRFAEFLTREG